MWRKITTPRLETSPRALELTAADELLAIENVDVLRKNGFEVQIEGEKNNSVLREVEGLEGEEEGEHEMVGGRLKLVAQPVSKSTVFDMKGELSYSLSLLSDVGPFLLIHTRTPYR